MADDLMGYLGIDTKSFQSSIGKAEKSVGFFAKAGIIATGVFAAFAASVNSFRTLGDEIDRMRAKMVRGTAEARDFESAIGGDQAGKNAVGFKRLSLEMDNFFLRLKTRAVGATKVLGALTRDVFWAVMGESKDGATMTKLRKGDDNKAREDESVSELKDKILDQEDQISEKQKEGVVTTQQHRDLLASELLLLKQQFELYRQGPFQDREKANALKAQIGAIKVQQQELEIAEENEIRRSTARTDSMRAENKGMANIAKMIETIADFEEKILKARREGKYVLEGQLEAQRKLTLQQLAVAEHNMTPRERMDARRTARKFARDVTKTERHEKDLDERAARAVREGHAPAPGSELGRHMARRAAERAGRAQNGKDAKAGGDPQTKMVTHLASIDGKLDAAFKQK